MVRWMPKGLLMKWPDDFHLIFTMLVRIYFGTIFIVQVFGFGIQILRTAGISA